MHAHSYAGDHPKTAGGTASILSPVKYGKAYVYNQITEGRRAAQDFLSGSRP